MATRHEISCIKKTELPGAHERIRSIGGASIVGVGPDGLNGIRWAMTHQIALDGIESGKWEFYIEMSGGQAMVIVANHLGLKYLKTELCGLHPDTLLNLPEC